MDTPTPSTAAALDPASVVADIAGTAAASMPAPPAPAAPPAPEPRPTAPASGPILTDKGGTVFDPRKHKSYPDGSPFLNKNERFMPIGGRKPAGANPPAAAPVAPAAPDPAAIAAAKTAWSPTDRAAATAAAPAEAAGAQAEDGAAAPVENRGEDARLAPEQAGELMSRVLYTATGAFTGDHATASATGPEHANLVRTFTAFMRFRGYTVTGWGALGFSVLAFLVDEKRRAAVWTKVRGLLFGPPAPKAERRAEPVPAPAGAATPARAHVVAPTPAPGAPAAPPADPRRDWLKGLAAE